MVEADNRIRQLVRSHTEDFKTDKYEEYVRRMKLEWGNIGKQEDEIKKILGEFLCDWGTMKRTLRQFNWFGWEEGVMDVLKDKKTELEQFRGKSIRVVNLEPFEDNIKELYDRLKSSRGSGKPLGPIASSKILNLVCPNFFPMWDRDIAAGFRIEMGKRWQVHFDKGTKRWSAANYFRFMGGVKLFMKNHEDVISSLIEELSTERPGIRALRIVDMCFWQAQRRPFFLIF